MEWVLFESNDMVLVEVDDNGLVIVVDLFGNVLIMVCYFGCVVVFLGFVLFGLFINFSVIFNNFIDEFVFVNLNNLGILILELCDDMIFLRWVMIDIGGWILMEVEIWEFFFDVDFNKWVK